MQIDVQVVMYMRFRLHNHLHQYLHMFLINMAYRLKSNQPT